jgi:3-hydroxyisobutyryl-CoA hydrolase
MLRLLYDPNVAIYFKQTSSLSSGSRLGAFDLIHSGIATHFVSQDRLLDLEAEIIKNIKDDEDHRKTKETLDEILKHYHDTNPSQPDESKATLLKNAESISKNFHSRNSIEDIISSLELERTSEWAVKTLANLRKQPPLSLKVTHSLFSSAEKKLEIGLKECLEIEYRLMMHCLKDSNFKEGIRAALIEKG